MKQDFGQPVSSQHLPHVPYSKLKLEPTSLRKGLLNYTAMPATKYHWYIAALRRWKDISSQQESDFAQIALQKLINNLWIP